MSLQLLGPWLGPTGNYVITRTVTTTGVQVGDLLRAAFVGYSSADRRTSSPVVPSGWTVNSVNFSIYSSGYTLFFYTASKLADAADAAAQSFTFSVSPSTGGGSDGGDALMWAWRGVDPITPYESAASVLVGSGNTVTSPVVTSTTATGMLEAAYFEEGSASAAPTLPAGLTSAGILLDPSNGAAIRAAYKTLTATGSQAQYTSTLSNTVNAANASAGFGTAIIIREAAAGPPPLTAGFSFSEPRDAFVASTTLGTLTTLAAALAESRDGLSASSTVGPAPLMASAGLIEPRDTFAAAATVGTAPSGSQATVVAHTHAADRAGLGATPMVAPAINTTGANCLLAQVLTQGLGTFGTVSDSYGNTWTQIGTTQGYAGVNAGSALFACESPVVGAGHVFQFNKAAAYADNESSLFVAALGGTSGVGAWNYNGADTDTGTVTTVGSNSAVVQFWGPADFNGGGVSSVYIAPAGWTTLDKVDTSVYTDAALNMNTGASAVVAAPSPGVVTGTWTHTLSLQLTQSMWTVEVKGVAGSTGLSASAALLDARDAVATSAAASVAAQRVASEPRDNTTGAFATEVRAAAQVGEPRDALSLSAAVALAASYAESEQRDALAAAAQAMQSAVLGAALNEARDVFAAAAAVQTAAGAALSSSADVAGAQAQALAAMAANLSQQADALTTQAAAPITVGRAGSEARDALAADLFAANTALLAANLVEQADVLSAAAQAQTLAGAVLAEQDAMAAAAATRSAAQAGLAEAADAPAADLLNNPAAVLALQVIEARDVFSAIAHATVLAGVVLSDTDTLAASATTATQAQRSSTEAADALAASMFMVPPVSLLDPRYAVTLAAREFLATRAAREFLAILRNGTIMTDTTEDKDPAEPAELTFSFDEALPAGVTLTGAVLIDVQALGGVDAALPTWRTTLTPQVGVLAAVKNGITIPAGRYATLLFPPNAGISGLRYQFAIMGVTSDPDIAPVCKAIVPVVR